MDRDLLISRVTGCLLGMAVGDALAACAGGMAPYAIMRRYGTLNAFYPHAGHKAGHYTYCSRTALVTANSILNSGKVDQKLILDALVLTLDKCHDMDMVSKKVLEAKRDSDIEFMPMPVLTNFCCPRAIPVGLYAAATGIDGMDLLKAVKAAVSTTNPSRPAALAGFVTAKIIRESIVCGGSLTNPYEWYQGDRSFLVRLTGFVRDIEETMFSGEDALEDNLSGRLQHVRKCLQSDMGANEFAGINGTSSNIMESVPLVVFMFLKGCDSFRSVINTAMLGGGASSVNSALVGALVGANSGPGYIPEEMRASVENGAMIASLGEALAESLLKIADGSESKAEPAAN